MLDCLVLLGLCLTDELVWWISCAAGRWWISVNLLWVCWAFFPEWINCGCLSLWYCLMPAYPPFLSRITEIPSFTMRLVIVWYYISLCGFPGTPHGSGRLSPPVMVPQDKQYCREWTAKYVSLTFLTVTAAKILECSYLSWGLWCLWSKWLIIVEESLHCYCLLVLKEHFNIPATSFTWNVLTTSLLTDVKGSNIKYKVIILSLILFSGHFGTNPGAVTPAQCLTPADLESRSGLGVIDISVRSLFSQMFKIWINLITPDTVLSA